MVAVVVVGGILSVCTLPFWSAIQMGNMEVEEVIERHVATLLMQDQAWISAEFDRFFPADTILFWGQCCRWSGAVSTCACSGTWTCLILSLMEWLNGSTLTPTATQRRSQPPIWRFAPFFLGANSEVLPRVSVSTSLSADHEVCRLCRLFFA